jgi:hypothetical protein
MAGTHTERPPEQPLAELERELMKAYVAGKGPRPYVRLLHGPELSGRAVRC